MNLNFQRCKRPALIGVGVILAVLAFAWLALPGIIQSQAEKFVAEKTGHRLTLARLEINPLALSLRLADLRLADSTGAPLASFGELFVDLSAASLTERALVFDEIRLDGLNASVVLRKDGSFNWSVLLDALQDKEPRPDSKGLPRLDIRHLRVSGAQFAVADQRTAPAFTTRIEPLDLELTDVSTLPDDSGKFRLTARTVFGAQLAWHGDITLNPLASNGHIALSDIDLARLAPLLKDRLPIAPPSGVASLAADYRLARKDAALSLSFEQAGLSISALRLAMTTAGAPLLAVDHVEITHGQFDPGSRQLALGVIRLRGNRLEAAPEKQAQKPVLTLDDITLTDARVDLARRSVTLASLVSQGGGLSARRDAQGEFDLLGVIDAFAAKPAAKPLASAGSASISASMPSASTAQTAPWRFRVEHAALAGFDIAVRDETVSPAAELGLEKLSVAVDGVSENLKTALPLKASVDARGGGRLEIVGQLVPADAAVDVQVKLTDLALKGAQPYVAKFAALDLVGGKLSAAGRITRNADGSAYRGSFALRDLRLNEAGAQNVFLAWKSLASNDLEVTPTQLNMVLLSLDGLDTKLIIDKDKSTNLKRVLHADAAVTDSRSGVPGTQSAPAPTLDAPAATVATVATVAEAPAVTPKAATGFLVNVDRLRFRNGELFFADHSLILPFGTRIHGLRGSIAGLSSKPATASKFGQLELDGEVDEFGMARAVGEVNFFKPTEFMDLKVIFRNVEMTHLTPYSATFAGRKIDSGKLSLELEYKIKQRQLTGENRIVIDRLALGERVESPTAKDLPLDLAIALLSDSDGRIDLGLPISGSLDDPQFSYGQIVWKAITNVLGKIVTAPFRALGALFGGGGEKLDNIAFEAGASSLTPPEREKLTRLVTVLNKRPGLALTVHGVWAEVDRMALQDLQTRRAVAVRSGQSAATKGDPGPISTRTPKVQSALEALFADRFGSAELAALKQGFRSANPGQLEESMTGKMMSRLSGLMREQRSLSETEVDRLKGADFHAVLFERLRGAETVKDEAMLALAAKRGEFVMSALKAAGAPEARVRQGGAEKMDAEGREVLLKLEVGKAGG